MNAGCRLDRSGSEEETALLVKPSGERNRSGSTVSVKTRRHRDGRMTSHARDRIDAKVTSARTSADHEIHLPCRAFILLHELQSGAVRLKIVHGTHKVIRAKLPRPGRATETFVFAATRKLIESSGAFRVFDIKIQVAAWDVDRLQAASGRLQSGNGPIVA